MVMGGNGNEGMGMGGNGNEKKTFPDTSNLNQNIKYNQYSDSFRLYIFICLLSSVVSVQFFIFRYKRNFSNETLTSYFRFE